MKTTTFQVIIYKFYTNQLSSPDELVTDSSLVSGASKIMRCISLTSKYWAAIFKGTNDHVTSTASKNQKLSEKEGFKNSEKYEDGGIPCILPSKKDWGLKSCSGSEFQAKYQPEKQACVYVKALISRSVYLRPRPPRICFVLLTP